MRRVKIILLPLLVTALSSCSLPDTAPGYEIIESKYDYSDYAKHTGYMSVCPSVGESKILVVPVWFTDSNKYISTSNREDVRSDINAGYFGTSEETGWESVKTYYYKDSFGKCLMDGFTTDWYECGKPSSDFYQDSDATAQLVIDSVNWYKETYNDISMIDFDKDSDGYLDGVVLIYAAPDYISARESSRSNLWAYTSWVGTDSNYVRPNPNAFFWSSYDFMYSTSKALKRTGLTSYGRGDTRFCNVDSHTFIHEMGHVFGLSDYYDYGGVASPAAGFSMQDYNVGAHDPYSRLALGWGTALIPFKTTTFTVKPIEESGEMVILSPEYTGSPFDEYIILELYTPTGLNKFDSEHAYSGYYPQGSSVAGVRVWHVDARLVEIVYDYNTEQWYLGKLTTAPTSTLTKLTWHATSNSNGSRGINYAGNYDYNELELIRNDVDESYNSTMPLMEYSLFQTGDTFSIAKYSKQFVNKFKLNGKTRFDWEVTFNSVTSEGMNITCKII